MGKKVKTINLRKVAEVLGISRQTARALVKKDGFPVEKRGSPGVPYEFDTVKVAKWKAEKERQLEENRVAHEARLAQARAIFNTRS